MFTICYLLSAPIKYWRCGSLFYFGNEARHCCRRKFSYLANVHPKSEFLMTCEIDIPPQSNRNSIQTSTNPLFALWTRSWRLCRLKKQFVINFSSNAQEPFDWSRQTSNSRWKSFHGQESRCILEHLINFLQTCDNTFSREKAQL